MDSTAIIASAALDRALDGQNTIAINVANVNTPGFKRRVDGSGVALDSFKSHFERAQGQRPVPKAKYAVDFSQGDIRQTGNPLDVALNGKGFLKVNGPNGIRYTRNGSLTIDSEGKIITQSGQSVVLKDGGAPLSRTGGTVTIAPDGTILQGANKIGRLDIVSFPDLKALEPENTTQFKAPEGLQEEASDAQVVQYALEGSNVNAVTEFVSMISAQRHFDGVARMLQQLDRLQQEAIGRNS